jgi:hypothetical protein
MANWKLLSPASGPDRRKDGRAVVAGDADSALLVSQGWIKVGRVFSNASLQFPAGTVTWAGDPGNLNYETTGVPPFYGGALLRGNVMAFLNSAWTSIGHGPWPTAVGQLCLNSATGQWFWFDAFQWRALPGGASGSLNGGAFAGPVATLPAT